MRRIFQPSLWESSNSLEKEWSAKGELKSYPVTMSESGSNAANGVVYFIGLGGSGMLPLARLAHARGYRVMGSDAKLGPVSIQKMKEEGLEAFGPPDARRILQLKSATVVYSTAISEDHPERQAAQQLASGGTIRLLHRMDFLNELVQHCSIRLGMAGTHGKTSSTALAGWMLMELQKDPLIIAGGRPLYLERSIRNGPDVAVFETDESDGSFLRSNATHRLILNVDEDHLNHYGSFEELKKAFRRFAGEG
ncbi:MAG: hypothetical protein KDK25_00680, partial [Leptospiraceae bacterium]|nr:hypothetical protein [Leptospiraceae bacterium]